jgi:hypothetical protein
VPEQNENLTTNCPNCGQQVQYVPGGQDGYFPFCSRRCKLIDLGKWLEEEHRIEDSLQDRIPEGAREPGKGDKEG